MKIQKVFRGRDSLRRAPQMLEKLQISRPLIVGGDTLTGLLIRRNPGLMTAALFSGYHPNPDLDDAAEGARAFQRQDCDGLISIGGGSAIDTAKAIQAILAAGSAEAARNGQLPEKMTVPHLAIPGTAGSGAEATPNAVVYAENQKMSLASPGLTPDGVILDASLLDSLPVYHKKSCALDALCQGIESFWCRSATDDSRVHAYLAILGVLDNLKAYLDGDPHAAEEMMDAAYQSGKAISITRTTAAHAMSYQITKLLGPAHGHACMLTLPVLWDEMNRIDDMKDTLAQLAAVMRLGDPQMGPRLLKGILYDLDMAVPDMPDADTLNRLTDSVNTERLGNHPVPMRREDVNRVYRKAFLKAGEAERQACVDIWRYYGS